MTVHNLYDEAVLYDDQVRGARDVDTDEFVDIRVTAQLDRETGEFVVRVAELSFTPGQARLLLAKVASAVVHIDNLVREVPA